MMFQEDSGSDELFAGLRPGPAPAGLRARVLAAARQPQPEPPPGLADRLWGSTAARLAWVAAVLLLLATDLHLLAPQLAPRQAPATTEVMLVDGEPPLTHHHRRRRLTLAEGRRLVRQLLDGGVSTVRRAP